MSLSRLLPCTLLFFPNLITGNQYSQIYHRSGITVDKAFHVTDQMTLVDGSSKVHCAGICNLKNKDPDNVCNAFFLQDGVCNTGSRHEEHLILGSDVVIDEDVYTTGQCI